MGGQTFMKELMAHWPMSNMTTYARTQTHAEMICIAAKISDQASMR